MNYIEIMKMKYYLIFLFILELKTQCSFAHVLNECHNGAKSFLKQHSYFYKDAFLILSQYCCFTTQFGKLVKMLGYENKNVVCPKYFLNFHTSAEYS